ncbi:MAG: ATP-binding protein, partial [Chloroflexota bacterium]
MTTFINRESELAFLNELVHEQGAQFVMLYGRRRAGKTTLLTTWAQRTGVPYFYWVAKRDSKVGLIENLGEHILAWQQSQGQPQSATIPQPTNWDATLDLLAKAVQSAVEKADGPNSTCIVILDELSYILEADKAFASYLQAAWDHRFGHTNVKLFVSGSHMGMMTGLLKYNAPLYGRLTAQFPIRLLAFPDIAHFLPHYDVFQRLAVYAVVGGVPAYLERWRSTDTIAANIQRLFLQRTGWFRNEPMVLISDLTQRETDTYEAILRAIAHGKHGRNDIASVTRLSSTSLSHYLKRLVELELVERRIPATVPLSKRKNSRQGRYFLKDAYLRFYYRFVDANLHLIEQGLTQRLWNSMQTLFRAFVAETFEDLCRTWTLAQAQRNQLPIMPDVIGSHWASDAQIDVVAINWETKELLLGEAKWGDKPVGRSVITELIVKTPKVLAKIEKNLVDESKGNSRELWQDVTV